MTRRRGRERHLKVRPVGASVVTRDSTRGPGGRRVRVTKGVCGSRGLVSRVSSVRHSRAPCLLVAFGVILGTWVPVDSSLTSDDGARGPFQGLVRGLWVLDGGGGRDVVRGSGLGVDGAGSPTGSGTGYPPVRSSFGPRLRPCPRCFRDPETGRSPSRVVSDSFSGAPRLNNAPAFPL